MAWFGRHPVLLLFRSFHDLPMVSQSVVLFYPTFDVGDRPHMVSQLVVLFYPTFDVGDRPHWT